MRKGKVDLRSDEYRLSIILDELLSLNVGDTYRIYEDGDKDRYELVRLKWSVSASKCGLHSALYYKSLHQENVVRWSFYFDRVLNICEQAQPGSLERLLSLSASRPVLQCTTIETALEDYTIDVVYRTYFKTYADVYAAVVQNGGEEYFKTTHWYGLPNWNNYAIIVGSCFSRLKREQDMSRYDR